MILDISAGEVAMFILALIATGVIAGLLAGTFGVGGGAVIVPVFYQFLTALHVDPELCMHIAIGTSLGIIIPTSIRSFLSHKKRGAVDMALLRSWAVPVILGVVLGAVIANLLSNDGLKGIFAILALLVGLRLVFRIGGQRLAATMPGQPALSLIGGAIGTSSTLMGIGGGTFCNAVMTIYGRPIHQAVATSSGLGVLISIPGAIGFMWLGWGQEGLPPLSLGYVNLLGVLLVVPISTLVAPLGVRLAHALERRQLEMGFGIFLLIVAARFGYSFL